MMHRTRGLTLIELMVTLAITALLVTAALGAITTLSRLEAADGERYATDELASQLRIVFAADVTHGKRFDIRKAGFALETLSSVKADSMELEHVPATVTYDVRTLAGTRWLIRSQRSNVGTGSFVELVAPGVSAVAIESDAKQRKGRQKWQAIGSKTTVTVTFESADRPPVVFIFGNG